MTQPLVPSAPLAAIPGNVGSDAVLDRFLSVMADRKLELYPEQEEAVLELFGGRNIILNTPTGSGKSLVATAFHFKALCAGERSVYTCPIKALVNEKFLALCRDFGPENVGMMTGDASVNLEAPILCCTAEILANMALAGERRAEIGAVIMDEFHYYSDPERGTAWQVPLLTLNRSRFLLMSATLGNTAFLESEIERLTGAPCITVRSDRRPVPLEFEYSETPLTEKVEMLVNQKKAPVYLVHFTQRAAADAAQALMSLNLCSREEKAVLGTELERLRFSSPYGKEMRRWLRHGIGVHHAGLLPKYRILVEQLAQKGLLKLICGTDTLGVGINVPIRTVVFTKAANDAKKQKKLVKKRPPEGEVNWDANTFQKLLTGQPEALGSKFDVSHGMLLQVLSRDDDGCAAMRRLIADSHETPPRKRQLRHKSFQLLRGLLDRKLIEWIPPQPSGKKLRVNIDLQADFSLHQTLSLYLIDTLPLLDRTSPDYPFDVLTLCEAIVEDPDAILRRQVDKQKSIKLEEMRAEGIPYEERIQRLEEIEHPKPLREFLYDTFNQFAAAHPWIGQENVRPKSIAREMYERYLSFAEYIREYGLERSEGLLLRHLSQVWKVLAQTVPESFKTDEIAELEIYFRELIRAVDSSLLEEWERLLNPDFVAEAGSDKPARPASFDITRDKESFRRLVRTKVFSFLQEVALRDWESAASLLLSDQTTAPQEGEPLSPQARQIEAAFAPYFEKRERFRLDPEGRASKNSHWLEEPAEWKLSQVLIDADGQNDWEVRFTISLAQSRTENRAAARFDGVSQIGTYNP